MPLKKREAIKLHRKMWGLLAKNPVWTKQDALAKMGYAGESKGPANDCFACDYQEDQAKRKRRDIEDCTLCPVLWPGEDCVNIKGYDEKGLFSMWSRGQASNMIQDYEYEREGKEWRQFRTKYAKLIQSLPVRGRIT